MDEMVNDVFSEMLANATIECSPGDVNEDGSCSLDFAANMVVFVDRLLSNTYPDALKIAEGLDHTTLAHFALQMVCIARKIY